MGVKNGGKVILARMEQPDRWAVVLAGGEGSRMRPFIESWLGRHLPKQYCAFKGTRTMIEHTMTRAVDAVGSEKIVTVIGSGHWRHLDEPRRLQIPGRIVEQPENRDTGPGLFLGLSRGMAADPDALVAVLPSDHYFLAAALARTCARPSRSPDAFRRASSLGVRPDRPETDYGWIETGGPCWTCPGPLSPWQDSMRSRIRRPRRT